MKLEDSKVWLFSFADLAFLLLIAFTQASTIGKKPVHIGEITIPKVVDNKSVSKIVQPAISYQIRVLKPTIPETNPYQMVIIRDTAIEVQPKLLSPLDLSNILTTLRLEGKQRPMLLPDLYSLSKDTLMAMSIIEKTYEDGNKITIQRSGGLH